MKTYWFINTSLGPRIVFSRTLWEAVWWAEYLMGPVSLAREARPQEVQHSNIKHLDF